MELLLDTCSLLWALFDDKKLPESVREMLKNIDTDVYVSSASLWEIAIKNAKHPDLMPYSLDDVYNVIINYTDYIVLPILPNHLLVLDEIIKQNIHQDPFDHIIMATSQVENLPLITSDSNIKRYQGIKILS